MFAGVPPIVSLGTNKLQSLLCEFSASLLFFRKSEHKFSGIRLGMVFTFLGATTGTFLLARTNVGALKILVPYLLLAVFLYNIFSKRKASAISEQNSIAQQNQTRLALLGICIGFYNGFFGPGTGTLWTIALMRQLRLGIRAATIYTKPLNLIGNLSALFMFGATGQLNIKVGAMMAVGSITGGLLGAHFVMYKDVRWLKILFNTFMALSVLGAFYHSFVQ